MIGFLMTRWLVSFYFKWHILWKPWLQLCLFISAEICDENEEYNPCGSSNPEPSCKNPNPDDCNDNKCNKGCFCKKGYVRNNKKKCIPVNECRKYF